MSKPLSELIKEPGFSEILNHARSFKVSALPEEIQEGYEDSRYFELTVEYRGRGKWAVTRMGSCYNRKGERGHESPPSGRTEEFLNEFRFSFEEAVEIAERVAPELRVNRFTVQDMIDRWESGYREEY
jgi:hypothetical protein